MTRSRWRIAMLGPADSIHLQRWAAALVARGHAVSVVSQHRVERSLLPALAEVPWLPHEGQLGYFTNTLALRRHLAVWQPDLLNVHYASGYGTTGALAGFQPTLLSVWGSDVYDFPYESAFKGWLVRRVLRRATAIASTSHAMAAQVRRLTPERRDVAVTPFGVDPGRFSVRPSPQGPLTVGIVKSLAPKYGVDLLLRAFAGLCSDAQVHAAQPACRLLIVGDGPQRDELIRLAVQLGVAERTQWVGAVPHADVPNWLHQMHIYAAPSRLDSESFGVAVIEAGACGLPVVVSDTGGLREVVLDGQTGLVVPREDVAALQAALKRLVLDADLRESLGRQGRTHVEREYRWDRCVDRMEDVYADTIRAALAP